MAENILNIVTKVDRPTFTIDGEPHELRHPDELSMEEFHLLQTHGSRLNEAGESYSEDPDGAYQKITSSMDALLDMITPDLPREIRDKLNPYHVQKILESFIELSPIGRTRGERPSRKKSSRGSRGSTAKRRATG